MTWRPAAERWAASMISSPRIDRDSPAGVRFRVAMLPSVRRSEPAGRGGATPWHQDEAYRADPNFAYNQVSFWIPLQHATEQNGCMQFIPGSKKGDLLTHRSRRTIHVSMHWNAPQILQWLPRSRAQWTWEVRQCTTAGHCISQAPIFPRSHATLTSWPSRCLPFLCVTSGRSHGIMKSLPRTWRDGEVGGSAAESSSRLPASSVLACDISPGDLY